MALDVVIPDEVKPVGALHVDVDDVVNWAAAGVPVPDAHVAVTLQSYKEPELRPERFAEVPVCAVEKFVQVEVEFSL